MQLKVNKFYEKGKVSLNTHKALTLEKKSIPFVFQTAL